VVKDVEGVEELLVCVLLLGFLCLQLEKVEKL
jgi:hypothetical protein